MKPADSILHCHTAKFKIAEAKYFLDRIKTDEIFQDDNLFSFHLNAFVNSSYSVVEYVHSDFYFHKVKIGWIEPNDFMFW